MNFKTTSILLALLLAVGTYLFLTREKGDAPKTDTAAKKLLSISTADVQSLTITPADSKPIAFVRDGTNWKLTQPIAGPAESAAVQALVGELTNLESQNSIEVSEGMGLKSPRFIVDLTTKDGKTTTLNIGDKMTIGDQLYVQLKGNAKADMVAAGVVESLDRPLEEFRQKRLLTVGMPEIKYVSIDRPGGKMELAKTGEAWAVTSPEAMPADPAAVSDLLIAITNLQATEFVDGADAASPMYGLGSGAKTITLSTVAPATQPSTRTAEQAAPIKITIGRPDTVLEKNLFATVVGTNVIVKVSKESLAFLDKKPLDFRDKLIADVEPKSVNSLTVTIERPATTQPTTMPAEKKLFAVMRRPPKPAATQPATTEPSTQPATKPAAEPPASTWITADKDGSAANDSAVERILAALHPLRAEKYVESAPTHGTTITVHLDTGGGGVFAKATTDFTILDPGDAKPPVATYNGLHFEIDRTLLENLTSDFTKPGRPAMERPEMPSPMQMGPMMP